MNTLHELAVRRELALAIARPVARFATAIADEAPRYKIANALADVDGAVLVDESGGLAVPADRTPERVGKSDAQATHSSFRVGISLASDNL